MAVKKINNTFDVMENQLTDDSIDELEDMLPNFPSNNSSDDYVPHIRNAREMSNRVKPLYIIDDYMHSTEDYIKFKEYFYDLIKGSFEHKDCREYPVKFKFYPHDNKVHTLQLRHFLINLFMWYPFVSIAKFKPMKEEFILDCFNDVTMKGLKRYCNEVIINTLRDYNVDSSIISQSLADAIFDLGSISTNFSFILGTSIETNSFMDIEEKYPRAKEISSYHMPPNIQPAEAEKIVAGMTKEMVDIFKNDPDNPIGVILRAGSGIKIQQLCEMFVLQLYLPDLLGRTIAKPINTNMVKEGFTKPSSMTIAAIGSRKSSVLNTDKMGIAGWFAKIVTLLSRTLSLSKDTFDCNSQHLIRVDVSSDKVLEKYDGRYYRVNSEKPLKVLKASKDKDLIGKIIFVRSPVTCCCGENEVCHVCFGSSAYMSRDISDGIAAYGSEEITKVINQSILSAKHLLTTASESIVFNDEFDKFFRLEESSIVPRLTDNPSIENIDDFGIYVNPSDIVRADDMDDDSPFNTMIESGRFYVKNLITGETTEIYEKNHKELYLTDTILKMIKKNHGLIKFKDITEDDALFNIEIMNNELTKPLYEIMHLLNRKRDTFITIDDLVSKLTSLLIVSEIAASSLQAELILNRLIRDGENIYNRPDFSKKKYPRYQVLTVQQALIANASPLVGLSFQSIKKQFTSDALYYDKHNESYLDDFYRESLSTKCIQPESQRANNQDNLDNTILEILATTDGESCEYKPEIDINKVKAMLNERIK